MTEKYEFLRANIQLVVERGKETERKMAIGRSTEP